jgi:uncharacterized phage protein gp47/JayE
LVAQQLDPGLDGLAECWEALEATYHAGDPDSAVGVHLDHLLNLNDVARLPATATRVLAALRGDEGTVVPAGNGASVSATGVQLEAVAESEITKDNAIKGLISVSSVQDSTVYSVEANGFTHEYESSGSATENEILEGLRDEINGSQAVVVASVVGTNLRLLPADLATPFPFDVGANLAIEETWSPQEYDVTATGPTQVLAETLDTIDNPVAGFQEITNFQDGVVGRDVETDTAARVRRKITLRKQASASAIAIQAKLISGDVPGVLTAVVYENITEVTDADGIPPHSVEAVVEGGDELLIAQAIDEKRAGGIPTFGNVNGGDGIDIVDGQGFTRAIKFSRPTPQYVHIECDLTLYSEEDFPEGGEDLVAAALLEFGQSLPVGKDLLVGRFRAAAVVAVEGVGAAVIRIDVTPAPGDSPTLDTVDIPIGIRERADFDSTRITVVVV